MHSQHPASGQQTASKLACIVGLSALLLTSDGRACGYHDDVSIARGALNWTYPDALHVIGAISAEVMQKRLQIGDTEPISPGPFGGQYHVIAKSLKRLAAELSAAAGPAPLSFSLVLIEPMLWTRFEAASAALQAQLHVTGPQPGDLILVSGQDVIRAIAEGVLAVGEAQGRGLIRLYGSEKQIAAFLDAFRDVGRERPDVYNQNRRTPAGSRSAVMR